MHCQHPDCALHAGLNISKSEWKLIWDRHACIHMKDCNSCFFSGESYPWSGLAYLKTWWSWWCVGLAFLSLCYWVKSSWLGRRRAGLLSGDDGLAPECMGPRAYHTLLRSGEKLHCCAVDDAGMAPRLERHHRSLWADIARSTASSRASPQPCVSLWWVVYQYCILLVTAVWSFGGWWSTLYHVGSELFLLWLKFWAVQWMIGI